jgi:hypothetical protein
LYVRFVEPWALVSEVGDELHPAKIQAVDTERNCVLFEMNAPLTIGGRAFRRFFATIRGETARVAALGEGRELPASAFPVSAAADDCAAAELETKAWRGGGVAAIVDLILR